jgi:plastocyanin
MSFDMSATRSHRSFSFWAQCRLAAVLWVLALTCAAAVPADGPAGDVTLRVEIAPDAHQRHVSTGAAQTVAWLVPEGGSGAPDPVSEPRTYRMVQKNKQFDPHLLVVPVGSLVEFPNLDPFFHNVFSLYNGKRFDLGLYETGSRRGVRFDREGVSYIFCNIHPEMGAVILALSTPYYAVSHEGAITISHVPPGKYTLNVWSENATQESENSARRQVTVSAEGASLGAIALAAAPSPARQHTNKFGQSYPPTPDSSRQGLPYP